MNSFSFYPQALFKKTVLKETVEIAYSDQGDKEAPVILFIHGLANCLLSWTYNVEELSKQYRCIAVDLPGNGLSSFSKEYPYSMDFFANCLNDFINNLNLKNVFLCGHSMGGQIAMTMAIKGNPNIKGLILCAPAGIERFQSFDKLFYKNTMSFLGFISSEETSLRKAIYNSFFIVPDNAKSHIEHLIELMDVQPRNEYKRMVELCINGMLEEPVFQDFSKIKIPVNIIFGANDLLIPNKLIHHYSLKEMLLEACVMLDDASFEIIPRCGHLVHWEKPEEVNHFIKIFVKEYSNSKSKMA
ncbi:MAG TPA: alpha/beta hydrolase [Edaphocola sp.]|nr:alpha/beta hydrolase [Edaphocola sp.]